MCSKLAGKEGRYENQRATDTVLTDEQIAELQKQLETARAALRKKMYEKLFKLERENQELRAQFVVMREALDEAKAALLVGYSMDCGFNECYSRTGIPNHSRCGAHESIIDAWFKVKNTLSTTVGRDLLERVKKLELVAEAARYLSITEVGSEAFYDTLEKLDEALADLERARE